MSIQSGVFDLPAIGGQEPAPLVAQWNVVMRCPACGSGAWAARAELPDRSCVFGSERTRAPYKSVISRPKMTSALAISSRFLPVRLSAWVWGKFKRAPKFILGLSCGSEIRFSAADPQHLAAESIQLGLVESLATALDEHERFFEHLERLVELFDAGEYLGQ